MEDSETMWVVTSIQSYSYVLLVMYPTICRCHCRSVLLRNCARTRKAIHATNTTWLPTVLYLLCSALDPHLVAQYQYPIRYLAFTLSGNQSRLLSMPPPNKANIIECYIDPRRVNKEKEREQDNQT